MGQGLIAAAEQMTAEALQIPYERIETVTSGYSENPKWRCYVRVPHDVYDGECSDSGCGRDEESTA